MYLLYREPLCIGVGIGLRLGIGRGLGVGVAYLFNRDVPQCSSSFTYRSYGFIVPQPQLHFTSFKRPVVYKWVRTVVLVCIYIGCRLTFHRCSRHRGGSSTRSQVRHLYKNTRIPDKKKVKKKMD